MTGVVFDIAHWSGHDGPGIRSVVFFKGCPLRCAWCHNPESQRYEPELLFLQTKCILCGRCMAACPSGARQRANGEMATDRARCDNCGRCAEACYTEALEVSGRRMSVRQVLDKVMDPARHRRCTGISNELALDNLGRLALLRKPIQVRAPLIPGYTDDDENLAAICQYAGRLGLQRIACLSYNPTTGAKYGWLERDCALGTVTTQSQERLEGIRALGPSYGLVVQIGG